MAERALSDGDNTRGPGKTRRIPLRFVVPVVIFVAIGVFLALGLSNDPRRIPSPLIGKAVPEFNLPPVQGYELGLSSANLKGQVSLVNVFASWCVSCRAEHRVLMDAHDRKLVPIHGLNYKDKPADARAWLAQRGNPYDRLGADLDGRVGIDWGVYGVPETFIIDRTGHIAYKQIGPMTPKILEQTIMPVVERLRTGGAS